MAKINTFRSVRAMIAIGIINIITVPLITALGKGNDKRGYLLIAVARQFLFGVTLYGRNADALYYFTYVEGNQALFSTYSLFIIIPSIIGAACFPVVFRLTNNKGRSASIFALLTGISMFCMYFFTVGQFWICGE